MYIQKVVFVEISPIIISHGWTNPLPIGTYILFELIKSMGKGIDGINNKLHFGVRLEVRQIGEPEICEKAFEIQILICFLSCACTIRTKI